MCELRESKRRAVEAENYDLAGELKARERQLTASMAALKQAAAAAALALASARQLPTLAAGATGTAQGGVPLELLPPTGEAGDEMWRTVVADLTEQAAMVDG